MRKFHVAVRHGKQDSSAFCFVLAKTLLTPAANHAPCTDINTEKEKQRARVQGANTDTERRREREQRRLRRRETD